MNDNLEIPRSSLFKRINWCDEMFKQTNDPTYKARASELRNLIEYYDQDDD